MSKTSTMKAGASPNKSTAAKARLTTNMKMMLGAGAVALAIGGLIIAAKPGPAPEVRPAAQAQPAGPAVAGRLSALQTRFNFGTVSMARGKVTHRYQITNTGTEPISIRKMYTSCMCTTAALVKNGKTFDAYGMPGHTPIPTMNEPLEGKDQAFVEVVFDPAAHGPAGVGPIERVVTIENSAGQPLELEFKAMVTP